MSVVLSSSEVTKEEKRVSFKVPEKRVLTGFVGVKGDSGDDRRIRPTEY